MRIEVVLRLYQGVVILGAKRKMLTGASWPSTEIDAEFRFTKYPAGGHADKASGRKIAARRVHPRSIAILCRHSKIEVKS